MKKTFTAILMLCSFAFASNAQTIVFHDAVKDSSGNLMPWYNPNHGKSYDHCLNLIWNKWKSIDTCCGGIKPYMADHTLSTTVQGNKIGGDQFAMLLSSWALTYAYTGDTFFIHDMKYIADTYLANSLSPDSAAWPNLPYPCNSGNPSTAVYDGDFLYGANVTQPDKAGSFGAELVTLYKITGNNNYLQAAVKIANTLADKVRPGDSITSPYPFRINAIGDTLPSDPVYAYTGNVVPTMLLFENLSKLHQGHTTKYDSATTIIRNWVKAYPLHTNNWGSFFEDIPVPSNTETNAVTMAWYILNHPDWGNTQLQDARSILDWVDTALGSHAYDSLGVTAIYEQSADLKEGGSHTSRFASVELLYAALSGDTSRRVQALRQLDWANYLVDTTGVVRFSPHGGSVWYTDGYGDYVRHYLRAMGAYPEIAPLSEDHFLQSTSVITDIKYNAPNNCGIEIDYSTFDSSSIDKIKLIWEPEFVYANGRSLPRLPNLTMDGYTYTPMGSYQGLVTIRHDHAKDIKLEVCLVGINTIEEMNNNMQIYPNPASSSVKVQYTTTHDQNATIEVMDMLGRQVMEKIVAAHASTNTEEINVAYLPAGTYVVRLTTGDGQAIKKLVVRK